MVFDVPMQNLRGKRTDALEQHFEVAGANCGIYYRQLPVEPFELVGKDCETRRARSNGGQLLGISRAKQDAKMWVRMEIRDKQ